MKQKTLVGLLERVETWKEPKVHLEQYPTPPAIAAQLLVLADHAGHLDAALVADLGCGGGVLAIGAAVLADETGATIVAVDVDPAALEVAARNCDALAVADRVELLACDVITAPAWRRGVFDCVLINPPFGTQEHSHGADVAFLRAGVSACAPGGVVYSMHKTATRAFVRKTAAEMAGVQSVDVVAELRFDIPRMYRHHTKANRQVAVDVWRLVTEGGEM